MASSSHAAFHMEALRRQRIIDRAAMLRRLQEEKQQVFTCRYSKVCARVNGLSAGTTKRCNNTNREANGVFFLSELRGAAYSFPRDPQ